MAQNSSDNNGENAGGKVKLAILGSSIEPTGSPKYQSKSGYPKHYQGRLSIDVLFYNQFIFMKLPFWKSYV